MVGVIILASCSFTSNNRGSLSIKKVFEQRDPKGMREQAVQLLGGRDSGRENGKCKGPEEDHVGGYSKNVMVAKAE